jgi:hypothetical protein
MKRPYIVLTVLTGLILSVAAFTQDQNRSKGVTDIAEVHVGHGRPLMEAMPMPHIYHLEARHWPIGCEADRAEYIRTGLLPLEGSPCGSKFYDYMGENLVTSVGESGISKQMSDTAAQPASANYIALTNTGITPAVADTTLSGEIGSNGLQRAQGTFTDTSAALGTNPSMGAISQVGTSGATTVDYWVVACTFQGCTTITAATGAQTTASNSTLSTTVYNTSSFTGKLGAAFYRLIRTHNNTTPTGSLAGGGTITTADGEISAGYISCATVGGQTAGTAPTCNVADQSNTLGAFTVPGSDQTFAGKYTLTKTFTATGTQSAQAFGIFNAASTGTLFFEGTFSSASLITNDTLAFTETVYH